MRGVTRSAGKRGAPRRSASRRVASRLALASAGLLLPLLVLELGLRFLPVSAGNVKRSVSAGEPIPRYPADTEIVWSLGWDFARVVRKRTNGDGFFSEVEYSRPSAEPTLAVIGDSYVEAMQVANADALDGVLRRRPDRCGEIYSLGVSGAPLSQYLAFADFARRSYRPKAMVFVVVGNDFDESHERYRTSAGGAVFVEAPESGRLELATREHEASALRRIARRSALLRYLTFNARTDWGELGRRLLGSVGGSPRESASAPAFVGNTGAAADAERIRVSLDVLDRFFELLPEQTGLPPARVAFVLDGMRPDLYSPAALRVAENSYFGRMRRELATRARARGHEVIDLQPLFVERFRTEGRRFDVAGDGHWNEHGHALAAEAIAASALWRESCGAPPAIPARSRDVPAGLPAGLRIADGRAG
jgi:hypothetical protein